MQYHGVRLPKTARTIKALEIDHFFSKNTRGEFTIVMRSEICVRPSVLMSFEVSSLDREVLSHTEMSSRSRSFELCSAYLHYRPSTYSGQPFFCPEYVGDFWPPRIPDTTGIRVVRNTCNSMNFSN